MASVPTTSAGRSERRTHESRAAPAAREDSPSSAADAQRVAGGLKRRVEVVCTLGPKTRPSASNPPPRRGLLGGRGRPPGAKERLGSQRAAKVANTLVEDRLPAHRRYCGSAHG